MGTRQAMPGDTTKTRETSAEDIRDYAVRSGLYTSWLGYNLKPWVVIDQMTGHTYGVGDHEHSSLWDWYKENKPQAALAALKGSNPERYETLQNAKIKSDEWEAIKKAFFDHNRGNKDRPNLWRELQATHADLLAAHGLVQSFTREALNEYRIDDIYGNIEERDRSHALPLMHYALLYNEDEDTYLSVMIDARHNLSAIGRDARLNFVAIDEIDGAGRLSAEVTTQARWGWAEHFLHRNRYLPFFDSASVDALEEADRLRAVFNGEAENTEPAVKVGLFRFFPAFQRAYQGEDGYFQALVDVLGPKGNVRYCSDQGVRHSHWGPGFVGDAAHIGEAYEVTGDDFLRLYEQMNTQDRTAFERATDRFIQDVLPTVIDDIDDKGNKGFSIARNIAGTLATLKLAMTHGTGMFKAADWFRSHEETEHELLDIAMRTPGRWTRYNRTETIQERAPRF